MRLLVGVLALKKATQLAAIVFSAAEFPDVAGALELVAGADELAGAEEVAAADVVEEVPVVVPLLPQAATPIPSKPARMIRSDLLVLIASNLQLLTNRGAQG